MPLIHEGRQPSLQIIDPFEGLWLLAGICPADVILDVEQEVALRKGGCICRDAVDGAL